MSITFFDILWNFVPQHYVSVRKNYKRMLSVQEVDKEDAISSPRRVWSVVGIVVFFSALAAIACAFCCK